MPPNENTRSDARYPLHPPPPLHARISAERARSRLSILKALSGVSYGQSKEVLLLTYRALIKHRSHTCTRKPAFSKSAPTSPFSAHSSCSEHSSLSTPLTPLSRPLPEALRTQHTAVKVPTFRPASTDGRFDLCSYLPLRHAVPPLCSRRRGHHVPWRQQPPEPSSAGH